ncbi:MAG: hypothetical protein WBA39_23020 [Rivularia sp. (in: cyanobacteria)]
MIEVKIYVGKDYDFKARDGRGDRDDYYYFDAIIIDYVKAPGTDNIIASPGKKHTFDFDEYNSLSYTSNIKQIVQGVLFPKHLGGSKANCILVVQVKELKDYDLLQRIKSVQYIDEYIHDAPIVEVEPFVERKREQKEYGFLDTELEDFYSPGFTTGMTDIQRIDLAEDIYGIPDPRLISDD